MTKANDLASLLDANGDVVSSALDNVPASDLVNDTTPQLGGNLDLNSNNITGTGNIDVTGTALAHTVEIGDGSAGGTSEVMFSDNVSGRAKILYDHSASPNEEMGFEIAGTRYMTIENGGFVGIGESSPQKMLHITKNDSDGMIVLDANGATTDHQICFSKNYGTGGTTGGNYWGIGVDGSENKLVFAYDPNSQASLAADAKMVLDSGGNVGISKSAYGSISTDGFWWDNGASKFLQLSGTGTSPLYLNRNGSEGGIVNFYQSGTNVGNIGVNNGDNLRIQGNPSHSGIEFGTNAIFPHKNGSNVDATIDLGESSLRWKDLYLSGAVRIQGSTRTFNIEQNNYGLRFVDVDAGSAERMRVTAAGDVLIGTQTKETTGTTLYGSTANGFYIKTTSTCGYLITQAGVGGAGTFISLYSDNTNVGNITTNGSSTSYSTTSDYRLKTAVEYDWDATTRLKQLKPARFAWIADGDDAVPVDGFLAHEVSHDSDGNPLVPEAITGTKDGMRDEEYEVTPAVEATYDDDGNILTEAVPAVMGTRSAPDYQGIDQSKLTPLLTKALIEAVEKIEQLEARIIALETAE